MKREEFKKELEKRIEREKAYLLWIERLDKEKAREIASKKVMKEYQNKIMEYDNLFDELNNTHKNVQPEVIKENTKIIISSELKKKIKKTIL